MLRIRERLNKYFRWDIYRRLLPYVFPYKYAMAFVMVMTLVYSGLELLEPWPMKFLIDNALGGHALPGWLTQPFPFLSLSTPFAIALYAIVGGLVLAMMRNLLDVGTDYVKARINQGMNFRFKADLYGHFLKLSFKYHDRTSAGDSLYRVQNDTGFLSTMVWSNFRHLIAALVMFTGMLWIMLQLDWLIVVLALVVGPVQYASIFVYNKLFKEKSKRIRAMQSKLQSMMQEILACLRVVKAFGKEDSEQRRLEDHWWSAIHARMRLDFQQGIFSFIMRWFSKLDRSLILLVGAIHVIEGRLTIGELLVILAYVSQIQEPLEAIGHVLYDMQDSLISAERVMEIFDITPEIQDRPGAKELDHVLGTVGFRHVNFAYTQDHPVLQDVNFTVQAGEVVALVGPTGAGKTTLSSLVARFYDPSAGHVTLDGHDLRDLKVKTLRDNVSVVLQEPLLFSGTIRDNIAYGRPEAAIEEIQAAAKAANAHDFISALPDGYASTVGERGVTLSGGERQRICIARAFLKDAPVLILDEPTSSVDSRTESVILEAMDRLVVGRTTFIIAHRLSTIRSAGHILALEGGRLVEHGTHEELMRRRGLYAELVEEQVRGLQRSEIEVPA
jgi:ABC-type multidrug transport system fused ATPase/permease subunit